MAISGVKSGYISVKKAAVSIQYRLSIVKGGQKLNVENFGGGGGGRYRVGVLCIPTA